MEQTLVIIKPEALREKLVGRILYRFENAELRIAAIVCGVPPRSIAAQHYAEIPGTHGPIVYERLLAQLADPKGVLVLVLEGENAIAVTRSLVGAHYDPSKCAPNTIRGDYAADETAHAAAIANRAIRNLVHASADAAAAARELSIWAPVLY